MSDYYTDEKNQEVPYEDAQGEMPEASVRPRRKRKKRRKKRYLLKILIFLILCGGVYGLLRSSIFTIEEVNVPKTQQFQSSEIQSMAGVKKGMNIFAFSAGKGEEALKANPYIKEANISRKLPNTVSIEIEERFEAAVVKAGKGFAVIDEEGRVLRIVQQNPGLIQVSGLSLAAEVKTGEVANVKEEAALKRMQEVLGSIRRNELKFKELDVSKLIVKIHVRDKLYCTGNAQNLVIGMEEGDLQAVLNDLAKKGIKKGMVSVGDNQYFSFNKKLK